VKLGKKKWQSSKCNYVKNSLRFSITKKSSSYKIKDCFVTWNASGLKNWNYSQINELNVWYQLNLENSYFICLRHVYIHEVHFSKTPQRMASPKCEFCCGGDSCIFFLIIWYWRSKRVTRIYSTANLRHIDDSSHNGSSDEQSSSISAMFLTTSLETQNFFPEIRHEKVKPKYLMWFFWIQFLWIRTIWIHLILKAQITVCCKLCNWCYMNTV